MTIALSETVITEAQEAMQEKMEKLAIKTINKKEFEEADKIITSMDYNGLDTNELRIDLDIAISSELIKVEKEKGEGEDPTFYHEV